MQPPNYALGMDPRGVAQGDGITPPGPSSGPRL